MACAIDHRGGVSIVFLFLVFFFHGVPVGVMDIDWSFH